MRIKFQYLAYNLVPLSNFTAMYISHSLPIHLHDTDTEIENKCMDTMGKEGRGGLQHWD